MVVALQGSAKVRRLGNGHCLPLPTKDMRAEGIREGDEVVFTVVKPRPINPKAFGSLRKYLRGIDLQRLADEDREEREG
jgi:antitoxin component of MazEF toxin-antitoxin module